MAQHIVSSYDTDLENLRRSIAEMGGVAEKMMTDATDASCAVTPRSPRR